MLTFFRKYQKGFFIVTTGAIIVSFLFFGGAGAMDKTVKIKEEPLFKAVNGSMVTKQKVERMVQFISFSHLDFLDDRISSPNWLNDGVLEKEFLKSPLGALLAEKLMPQIQGELASVVKEARFFHPYRHPNAPFLTAEAVWGQFSAEGAKYASLLLGQGDIVDLKTFEILSAACLEHKSFPSVFLKRVLLYQENQDSRIRPDSGLPYADVSLLGLHSLQNWLGPTYLKAAAEVILNGSAYAESKGYSLSLADARMELLSNLQEAAKRVSKEVPPAELYPLFLQQVRKMGMEELECVSLWRDISLFRKLFHSVTIDPSSLEEFYAHAKKQAIIELFSLPTHLQLKDFSSLLKLQMYIQAVSSPKAYRSTLGFPKEFLSLAEVEKKNPELVRKEYVLEYAELDVKKAASHIGLKETWNWETSDSGWDILKKQFSELAKQNVSSKEERFATFDQLDDAVRLEVDKFSREKILLSDASRIKEMLLQTSPSQGSFLLSVKGDGLPFKNIKDKNRLMSLLEKGNLLEEDLLSFYTEDGIHYYSIRVIDNSAEKKILTFAEADASGSLGEMLDKKLEAIYPDVRKKDSLAYMQKEGGWMPLFKVKDKVGLTLFPDLLKAIQEEYSSFYGKSVSQEEKSSPLFYVQNRMLAPLREQRELVSINQALDSSSSELSKQWDFVKEVQTEWKSKKEFFPTDAAFNVPEGTISSITLNGSGKGYFYRMLGHLEAEEAPAAEEEAAIAPLRRQAKKNLAMDLLHNIDQKGAWNLEGPL